MNREMKTGRHGSLAVLGGLLLTALAPLALVSCGGDSGGESGGATPPPVEEAGDVVVRVSGTEGVEYEGDYGPPLDPQLVEGTLEGDLTEYEVDLGEGARADGVVAVFAKTQPSPGELRAEILADGVLVAESTTYVEFGSVSVDYPPAIPLGGEIPPPGEGGGEESP